MPDISFILQQEAELRIELSAAAGRRFYFEGVGNRHTGGFMAASGPSGTTAQEDQVQQANKRPPPVMLVIHVITLTVDAWPLLLRW